MSRSSSSLHGKASAPHRGTTREAVLEGQIRFRRLSLVDALRNMGFCCSLGPPVKLTAHGLCEYCTTRNVRSDCACTRNEVCCYHDMTTCYRCGELVTVGHRTPCA